MFTVLEPQTSEILPMPEVPLVAVELVSEKVKAVECEFCPKSFPSKGSLNMHESWVMG